MTLVPWIVIAFLTAMNAVYVAAEFAAVSVQRSEIVRLAREGNRRAAGLLGVLEDGSRLDRYIAACQIGITLASLIAGAYAQATITLELLPYFETAFDLSGVVAHTSAAVTVLLVLTALQVILGELVPKSIALDYPTETALITFIPTNASVSLYRFPIWLMNGAALLLLKPFGISATKHGHVHSSREIELLLAESRDSGKLSPELHQRLERGLQLPSRSVRQLMVPRQKLVAIEVSTPADEVIRLLRESPYSRIPVYRGNLDDFLGALNTKEVVALYASRRSLPPIERLLGRMPFVPENLSADRLVRFLQEKRASKAIVVNEFGGVEGLVSIEDVLVEVLGDVGDEIKPDEQLHEELADGRVRLSGSMALSDAEPWLGKAPHEYATTVGGLVTERLGALPVTGDAFTEGDWEIVVVDMGPTAVQWVELRPVANPVSSPEEPEGPR